jgi:uncharacterized protein YbaP (TraB family)
MHAFTLKGLMRGFFSVFLLSFLTISQAAETGLLWRLEAPNGTVSHIFGTIHIDDPRVTDFSPALLKALQESDIFMMEVLPSSDPSLFFLPDFDLQNALSETEWEKATQLAELHAMHEDSLRHMKPWMLAMIFDLPEPQSPFTPDVLLFAKAQEQARKIEGLEDARAHFSLLDDLSREEQLTILRTVLKHSQQERERDFDALVQAYLAGDLSVIAAVDEQTTGSMLPPELWQKIRIKLLVERNRTMANRIAEEAAQHKLFVAAGAAHLAGEGGILARLRKAGYKISAQ